MRKVIVSNNAKKDFNQIKAYVVKKFSLADWNNIVDEWQDNLKKVETILPFEPESQSLMEQDT